MLRAWLQLFRVPNLLTVPGDPLAGFLIATGGRLDARAGIAIVASLCLYAAGLAMNDLADLKEDQRDRPARPLPSGAISRGAAIFATLLLVGNALLILRFAAGPLAMMGGVLLLGTIAFYNLLAKRIPILGPLAMGVCRGFSLFLGIACGYAASSEWTAWAGSISISDPLAGTMLAPFAQIMGDVSKTRFSAGASASILMAIYIAAVTNLARHETGPSYPQLSRFLPLGALLLGNLALKYLLNTGPVLFDSAATLWIVGVVLCAITTSELMKIPPRPLPPRIGAFIRIMPVLQAALCLCTNIPVRSAPTPDSLLCAVVLLACVPLSAWLGRKFYAS